MNDVLRQRETEKYRKMWAVDAYRNHSPGVQALPRFYQLIGDVKGKKIIDFGCGTGRAARSMQIAGAQVMGVDLLRESLDPDARHHIPFIEACLWDLPPDLRCDVGYCTDVMEHIPTERVSDVLAEIRRVCTEGVFFQIATFPDGFGRRIGETLHETVKPGQWWRTQAKRHWEHVAVFGTARDVQLLCLN